MPLPDELERRRLLDRLDARWQHPVTVIVAGAGFGKSTLLAQAVRANALEPRGIDVWYSCTPGDVDAEGLGAALLRPWAPTAAGPTWPATSMMRSPGTRRSTSASCSTMPTRSGPDRRAPS